MVATVTPINGMQVIVVPGILKMLGPNTTLMSNDSRRCYMRKTHWENMKDSFALTSK
jgi:hypothetical protein